MNRGVFFATEEELDFLKGRMGNIGLDQLLSKLNASKNEIQLSSEEAEKILDEIGLDHKSLHKKLRDFLDTIK